MPIVSDYWIKYQFNGLYILESREWMSTKRPFLKTFRMIKKKCTISNEENYSVFRLCLLLPCVILYTRLMLLQCFFIFSFLPSALANGFAQFAQSQLFKIVLISPVLICPVKTRTEVKLNRANVSLWTVVIFLIPKILSSRMLGQLTANTV